MSGKPDHGAIEWRPVAWQGESSSVVLELEEMPNAFWRWRVFLKPDYAMIHEGAICADVGLAQRAAANWFIEWQKEQAQK